MSFYAAETLQTLVALLITKQAFHENGIINDLILFDLEYIQKVDEVTSTLEKAHSASNGRRLNINTFLGFHTFPFPITTPVTLFESVDP